MGDIIEKMKLRTKIDDPEKCFNIKKISKDDVKNEIPKRHVLRNLQNHVRPRTEADKNAVQRNMKDVKLPAIPSIKRIESPSKNGVYSEIAKTTTNAKVKFNCTKPTCVPIISSSKAVAFSNTDAQNQIIEEKMKTRTEQKVQSMQQTTIEKNKQEHSKQVEKSTTDVASEKNAIKSYSKMRIDAVRNIDDGDEKSLILVTEYVNDIYEYLFQLELEQPIRKRHLSDQEFITSKMRAILLDWINDIQSQFHLVTETFYITVGIIDRYLQKITDTQRNDLQLVGITALFLATKFEELFPPKLSDFIYLTDNSYNRQQILEMEMKILRTLDWNLSRPVSIHFLRRFSKAQGIDNFQYIISKYFLELAAIEYSLASYRPSEIAAASLFLCLHLTKGAKEEIVGFNDSYWDATLQHYSHYTALHLRPITRKIASIARHAPEAKLNAVYRKYQSSKLYKASMSAVLYGALMDSLIKNDI